MRMRMRIEWELPLDFISTRPDISINYGELGLFYSSYMWATLYPDTLRT